MATLNISPSDLSFLANKVAIITGGGSGIGLATAQLFADHEAHVVIADLNPPTTPIPSSAFAKCDVTVWTDILSAFSLALENFGPVDIVIANARVGEIDGDIFRDEYDADGQLKPSTYRTIDINLVGVMSSSTVGYMSEPGVPIYSAAKHSVVGFMRAVTRACAKHNIQISCASPWMTSTRLIYPALRKTMAEANIPVQSPEDVALAMGYAAAKEGWTGKSIYVAAGRYTEIEEPMLRLEKDWLGIENLRIFRRGQELDYMTRTDVEKEHKGGFL